MFYHDLKHKRESLGISLEQIAARTKINKDILFDFENGNFSRLPKTYTRLFLKAYALEIGADQQRVLQDLEEYLGTPTPAASTPVNPESQQPEPPATNGNRGTIISQKSNRNFISAIVAIVVLVFIIAILKQIFFEESQIQGQLTPMSNTGLYTPDTLHQVRTDSLRVVPQSRLLTLTLLTRDSCWVKITIDDKETFEANLPPHYKRELRAQNKYDVLVGRPGEINLILNGRDLGPIGVPGTPTRVIVTKDGIMRRQAFSR